MSDEVCGYLRHIASGTCVGVNEDKVLITNKDSCLDKEHIFCQNTKNKIMVFVTKNGSGETISREKVYSFGGLLGLTKNGENPDAEKWRFKMNGRIRAESNNTICWQRDSHETTIMLDKCAKNQTADIVKSQQFGIQLQKDKLGMLITYFHLIANH